MHRQWGRGMRRFAISNKEKWFGGQNIIDTPLTSDVSAAPLVTTFLSHPVLNALPGYFTYDNTLSDGVAAADRQYLAGVVRLPNLEVPFVSVDV